MSRGHQKYIVTGQLSADPVVKAPQSGGLVAELRIPVSESFKDRAGNKIEHTEWIRAKAFGRNAEIAQQYLTKGRLVTIEGKLHTEKWQAADGSDRYSTWIYVSPTGLTMHGGGEHQQTKREHQGRGAAEERQASAPTPTNQDWPDDDEIRF